MSEQTEAMEQEVSITPPLPEAAPHASSSPETTTVGQIISRARTTSKFLPAATSPADSAVVVGRGLLRSKAAPQKQQLSRERKIAGDLPSWDPMPPGEISVRRPSRD